MKKLLGAVLMASLMLACGGSELSDVNDKAASSSHQASLAAALPTLTTAECNFYGHSGSTFNICHVTGSGKFVPTAVTTSSCLTGHSGHAGDYIATATDPGCKNKDAARIPARAPVDNYIPCSSGYSVDGLCADVCVMGAEWSRGSDYNVVVPAGAVCRMQGEVKGKTIVYGTLYTMGSTFDGDVSVDGGCLTTANSGNTFMNNVSIKNSPGCWIGGSERDGFWTPYSDTVVCKNFSYSYDLAYPGAKYPFNIQNCDEYGINCHNVIVGDSFNVINASTSGNAPVVGREALPASCTQ